MKKNAHRTHIEHSKPKQNFKSSLEKYLDTIVKIEEKNYNSTLRPFTVFEEEIRNKAGNALRSFQKNYADGYKALVEELKHEMETSESKEDLLAAITVHPENLKIFENPDALLKAFQKGNSIYELLGFSEKSLNIFYHAGCCLIKKQEFTKARDLFYFLSTIAPRIYQFWICLGQCYKNLEESETALQVLLQAITIDPTQETAYLDIIDLFIQAHDFNRASKFCNIGLQFALEHQNEPWGKVLRSKLEEKRK